MQMYDIQSFTICCFNNLELSLKRYSRKLWQMPTYAKWESQRLNMPDCLSEFWLKVNYCLQKVPSMSLYLDFILILSRYYPDFFPISSRFYSDFIQIISRFYFIVYPDSLENPIYPDFIWIFEKIGIKWFFPNFIQIF